jgi:hypothetical protein
VTQKEGIRIVLDTNQIVGAGTRWLEDGQTSSNNNVHRRILIRVAQSHKGLYCGKVIGEYLEKLVDLHHPPARIVKMVAYIMGAFNTVEITTLRLPTLQRIQMMRFSCYAPLMVMLTTSSQRIALY